MFLILLKRLLLFSVTFSVIWKSCDIRNRKSKRLPCVENSSSKKTMKKWIQVHILYIYISLWTVRSLLRVVIVNCWVVSDFWCSTCSSHGVVFLHSINYMYWLPTTTQHHVTTVVELYSLPLDCWCCPFLCLFLCTTCCQKVCQKKIFF